MIDMPVIELSDRHERIVRRPRTPRSAAIDPGAIGRLAVRLNSRLSRAPRICVLGELNSGKSTLVNVLLATTVSPTSAAANTRLPIRIFHAASPSLIIETHDHQRIEVRADGLTSKLLDDAALIHAGLPLDRLQSFEVVDTPGLQSGDETLCDRATNACRQSHLAIWCTTANQAWKASELGVWQSLPKRLRSNGILAVTFKDAISCPSDEGRLWGRINAEAAPHFKKIVMISARDALASRQRRDPQASAQLWHMSGAAELTAAVDAHVSKLILERVRGAEKLLKSALAGTQYQSLTA